MAEIEVECPSGLKGVVRGLKGKEIDTFANKAEVRKRKVGDRILASTWIKTTNPGPYDQNADGSINWTKALTADRTFLTLMVRVATHGEEYEFPYRCTHSACERPFDWVVPLLKLPIRKIPEESLLNFADKNTFTTNLRLDDGTYVLEYGLHTGEMGVTAAEAQDLSPEARATISLSRRVRKIRKPDGEYMDTRDFKEFFEELDVGDIFDLIDAFDEHDGGVESEIDIYCPHCGHGMEGIDLPLGPTFWKPRKRSKSRTTKESRPSRVS